MSGFDPMTMVTLARLRYLVPGVSADDYAQAVLDLTSSLGEDVLADADLQKGTELRTKLAMQDTALAFGAISGILTSIASTEEHRENLVFLLAKAIDDSLNLGAFYMADRPKEDLPPPITAEQIEKIHREKSSKGGKRSVEKRQAALKQGWHKHARELALEIRAKSPSTAQKPLATEIGEQWKAEGFKPGFDALLAFIRACEADDSIPRRTV